MMSYSVHSTSGPDRRRRKRTRARSLLLEQLEVRNLLATFTVVNLDDVGTGSLRQAILDANASLNDVALGPDVISFNIPGAGPHTIQPQSALPLIDDAVLIDGYSQQQATSQATPNSQAIGTNAVLQIEIDGSQLSRPSDGLSISGQGTTVRGLVINRFPLAGIHASGQNHVFAGNFIGTDVSGTLARPNGFDGVLIDGGGQIRIGGMAAADRNLISGNAGSGVALQGAFDFPNNNTLIVGNLIGTTRNGFDPLPNQRDGVTVAFDEGTRIADNLIAHNFRSGVSVTSAISARSGTTISTNSIFLNQQLGIDLNADGVTPNDADDSDMGPNGLQNFPTLTSLFSGASSLAVTGTLVSLPLTNFQVEFFSNTVLDPTGHGEGEVFLGATNVTTDDSGTGNFSNVILPVVPSGRFITATATNAINGETSEFSDTHIPVITTTASVNAAENQTVVIDVQSTDPDGETENGGGLAYRLTGGEDQALFGIDTSTGVLTFNAAPNFEMPADFDADNLYKVQVTVTDAAGLTGVQALTVTVTDANEAPVLAAIGNQTVDEQATLTFTATATDQDSPAQNLAFSLDAAASAAGMSVDANTGAFSFTPTESQGGMVLSATITVNEVNVAPVLDPIGNKTVDELTTLSFMATASDVDNPSNTLTFSLSGAVPAGASITPAGAFSWTPSEAQGPGEFTFDVGVTDSGVPNLSVRETITVTVNEVNVAPVANPDTDETTENAVVTTDVLANDTDVDGDDNPTNFSLDNVNIDSTTGLLASPAAAGSVSIVGNQVAFDPDTDFDELDVGDTATVAINYTMSDDSGVASVSTLIITIMGVNDGPMAFGDRYVALPGVPIMIDGSTGVLANDFDVDSDDLLTVELFSGPQHGELMMLNTDGSFTYIARAGTVATSDSFVYTVLDPAGASDQATVVIDIPRTSVDLRASQADPMLMDFVIEDLDPGGKNDSLSLRFVNGELVITDNLHLIVDRTQTPPVVGQRIPIGNITAQNIIVNSLGGDDVLDIDLSGLTGGGLDRSLTINGGGGDNDRLVFSGATPLGGGALTVAGNDVEEILINGPITTNNAPVTLTTRRNLEVNADIKTYINTGAGGEVRLTANGHDIFGNCSLIQAGTADVHLVAGTGIADVRVQTTGDVTLNGGSGGIVGCTGEIAVSAQTLTLMADASVGTALRIASQTTITEPFRTSVDAIQGRVGGLGIFLINDRPLTDNVVLVDSAPLGVRKVCPGPGCGSSEGEGSPLQNSINRLDVNNDGAVSPVDALAVFNFLNAVGAQSEGSGSNRVMLYVDVNGDYAVSPVDGLAIINYLNRTHLLAAEGESSAFGQVEIEMTEPTSQALPANFAIAAGSNFTRQDVPYISTTAAARHGSDEPREWPNSPRLIPRAAQVEPEHRAALRRWLPSEEANDELERLLSEIAEDVGAVWSNLDGAARRP